MFIIGEKTIDTLHSSGFRCLFETRLDQRFDRISKKQSFPPFSWWPTSAVFLASRRTMKTLSME